jgi:ribosome-binding ATPase YchF (GTP1/OBG family)
MALASSALDLACGRPESTATIQRGFRLRRGIGWDELVDAGGYAAARDSGTLRIEGRDYVVADGEVLTVRFTP